MLAEAGVEVVFFLPGGHIAPVVNGCAGAGIRTVSTRHESGAVHMAEAWARCTGRTGVAAVTAGPGFTNAVTGLANAQATGIPVAVLAGRTPLGLRGRGAVQDADQEAVARAVAKWTRAATTPDLVGPTVREALAVARLGRPGAAYVELPTDVLLAPAADPARAAGRPRGRCRSHCDGAGRRRRGRAGGRAAGGRRAPGGRDRRRRVLGGRRAGARPASSPRPASRSRRPATPAACCPMRTRRASARSSTAGWPSPWRTSCSSWGAGSTATCCSAGHRCGTMDQTIVMVDHDPAAFALNRRPDLALQGDAAAVLDQLAAAWAAEPRVDHGPPRPASWADGSRDQWAAQTTGPAAGVHPGALAREVGEWAAGLGPGSTVVLDGGDILGWGLAFLRAEEPGSLLFTSDALARSGSACPTRSGPPCARPDGPTVALVGDGAFGPGAMEIETAVRAGAAPVMVVSNNASWGDVRYEEREWFGRTVGTDLSPARYDRLCAALGGHGERVESLAELRPALDRALASGVVSVVDVRTDPDRPNEVLAQHGGARPAVAAEPGGARSPRTSVLVVPRLHLLQCGDEPVGLLVAQPRSPVDHRVAVGRHRALEDRLDGIVGLAVVAVPGREVQLVATVLDVTADEPRERGDVRVRGQSVSLLWQA